MPICSPNARTAREGRLDACDSRASQRDGSPQSAETSLVNCKRSSRLCPRGARSPHKHSWIAEQHNAGDSAPRGTGFRNLGSCCNKGRVRQFYALSSRELRVRAVTPCDRRAPEFTRSPHAEIGKVRRLNSTSDPNPIRYSEAAYWPFRLFCGA